MFVNSIIPYYSPLNSNKNTIKPAFNAQSPKITDAKQKEYADLRVFHHHIYEFKKGIRNLILTTEKAVYRKPIEERLQNENIAYVIHDIGKNKINVYFGAPQCVDVVRTLNPKLNELTAEQDFILGIMLGYDRVKQCERYLNIKNNIIKLHSK